MNTCPLREAAAAFVLSDLGTGPRATLETHLTDGCAACEQEILVAGELAAPFGRLTGVAPPESLRATLLARLTTAPAPELLFQDQGPILARSAELDWQPMSPGVHFKTLHTHADRRHNTTLVRMAPGARYAAQRHVDGEEFFLLSGDYGRSGEGETFSDSGCLILVMASPHNEAVS